MNRLHRLIDYILHNSIVQFILQKHQHQSKGLSDLQRMINKGGKKWFLLTLEVVLNGGMRPFLLYLYLLIHKGPIKRIRRLFHINVSQIMNIVILSPLLTKLLLLLLLLNGGWHPKCCITEN